MEFPHDICVIIGFSEEEIVSKAGLKFSTLIYTLHFISIRL